MADDGDFDVGTFVVKSKGDYIFSGHVVTVFRKRSGAVRYVVENADGVLHIFNHSQLYKPGPGRVAS
jgi:hypothetical protein